MREHTEIGKKKAHSSPDFFPAPFRHVSRSLMLHVCCCCFFPPQISIIVCVRLRSRWYSTHTHTHSRNRCTAKQEIPCDFTNQILNLCKYKLGLAINFMFFFGRNRTSRYSCGDDNAWILEQRARLADETKIVVLHDRTLAISARMHRQFRFASPFCAMATVWMPRNVSVQTEQRRQPIVIYQIPAPA